MRSHDKKHTSTKRVFVQLRSIIIIIIISAQEHGSSKLLLHTANQIRAGVWFWLLPLWCLPVGVAKGMLVPVDLTCLCQYNKLSARKHSIETNRNSKVFGQVTIRSSAAFRSSSALMTTWQMQPCSGDRASQSHHMHANKLAGEVFLIFLAVCKTPPQGLSTPACTCRGCK